MPSKSPGSIGAQGQSPSEGTRSIRIGGDATGSTIVAGDRNVVHFQQVTLPAADEVDMASEVATLRELLGRLDSTDRRKIDNAFADAADELARPEPDRDEVGKALDRALEYGKKAKDFAGIVETLKPHVVGAVGWLGKNWHKILGVVGLTV